MHFCFRCWSKINRYISVPAFSFPDSPRLAILALCHGRLGHPKAHGCHGRLAGSTPVDLSSISSSPGVEPSTSRPALGHPHPFSTLLPVIGCLELIHRSVKHHKWLVIPNLQLYWQPQNQGLSIDVPSGEGVQSGCLLLIFMEVTFSRYPCSNSCPPRGQQTGADFTNFISQSKSWNSRATTF